MWNRSTYTALKDVHHSKLTKQVAKHNVYYNLTSVIKGKIACKNSYQIINMVTIGGGGVGGTIKKEEDFHILYSILFDFITSMYFFCYFKT